MRLYLTIQSTRELIKNGKKRVGYVPRCERVLNNKQQWQAAHTSQGEQHRNARWVFGGLGVVDWEKLTENERILSPNKALALVSLSTMWKIFLSFFRTSTESSLPSERGACVDEFALCAVWKLLAVQQLMLKINFFFLSSPLSNLPVDVNFSFSENVHRVERICRVMVCRRVKWEEKAPKKKKRWKSEEEERDFFSVWKIPLG